MLSKLKWIFALTCILGGSFVAPVPAWAASASGFDTPPGQTELPIAVQGQVGLDLLTSGSTSTSLAQTTSPPNVVVPGNLIILAQATVGAACPINGSLAQDGTGVLLTCTLNVWQRAGGASFGMIAPYRIMNYVNGGAIPWSVVSVPASVPTTARYLLLQYEVAVWGPDGHWVPNSHLYARANNSGSAYLITAAQSAGDSDAVGHGGQVTVPFDTATRTFQISVDFGIYGVYYVWIVGYM